MPKNDFSWNKHEKRMADAKALAEFLDVQDNTFEVRQFRRRHADFLPPKVWDILGPLPNNQPGAIPMWKVLQLRLRQLWDKGFPEKDVLGILSDYGISMLADYPEGVQGASRERFRTAIMFLYGESWRVKGPCKQCGSHFVADNSQQKCCSVPCAVEFRAEYKENRHERIKDQLNARRRREYAAKKDGANPRRTRKSR